MRRLGDPVKVEMTKWGDRRHWHFDGVWLGEDEHGEWIGFPAGTHNHRPGFEFRSEVDCVTLVPRDGWYAATFHAPGIWCDLYVDMATPGIWDDDVLRAVDLDLDVIRMSPDFPSGSPLGPQNRVAGPGELFVDDEDEFAEHQVTCGYPPDVVASARAACDRVLAAARAGEAPYDGTHRSWLTLLASITARGSADSAG